MERHAVLSDRAGRMMLADRLRAALERVHDQQSVLLTGDYRDENIAPDETLSDAGVLVAVTDRPTPGIILTERAAHLSRHAGQVAFPGGRQDVDDSDIVATALREAEEEIALPRSQVDVVGIADRYRTVTGFRVTPVIGVIAPDIRLTPEPGEVAHIFEIPLDFALDSGNHVEASVEWQGRNRHYYEIVWDGHRIWGATAAMIVNLSRRLRWSK